jgi:hypothetical protein
MLVNRQRHHSADRTNQSFRKYFLNDRTVQQKERGIQSTNGLRQESHTACTRCATYSNTYIHMLLWSTEMQFSQPAARLTDPTYVSGAMTLLDTLQTDYLSELVRVRGVLPLEGCPPMGLARTGMSACFGSRFAASGVGKERAVFGLFEEASMIASLYTRNPFCGVSRNPKESSPRLRLRHSLPLASSSRRHNTSPGTSAAAR